MDCAEELRNPRGGAMQDAFLMTPAEVMVHFWRYKRVADKLLVNEAQAHRAAFSDGDGWKAWVATMDAMTQEIDQSERSAEKVEKKLGRKVLGPVSLEELDDDE